MEFLFADISQLGEIERLERENLNNHWSITQLEEFVAHGGKILSLLHDNIIVGYISFKIIIDEAEINNLAVDKNYRNRGYGTALLQYTENFMTDNNVVNVFLEVSEHNEVALKLYQKHNYNQYGIRKNYYKQGDNALLLRKSL